MRIRTVNVNIGTLDAPVLRPAFVVADWGHGCFNVQVLLDGTNDLISVKEHLVSCGASEDIAAREAHHICSRGPWWLTSINEGEGHHNWSKPSLPLSTDEV